ELASSPREAYNRPRVPGTASPIRTPWWLRSEKESALPGGIHHVTSIAGSARRNLDFYTRTLGLRLVKKTVNFDDPGSYHFYYGDAAGHPGTILTFFPWEGVPPGRLGIGEAQETVFSVPEGSIG